MRPPQEVRWYSDGATGRARPAGTGCSRTRRAGGDRLLAHPAAVGPRTLPPTLGPLALERFAGRLQRAGPLVQRRLGLGVGLRRPVAVARRPLELLARRVQLALNAVQLGRGLARFRAGGPGQLELGAQLPHLDPHPPALGALGLQRLLERVAAPPLTLQRLGGRRRARPGPFQLLPGAVGSPPPLGGGAWRRPAGPAGQRHRDVRRDRQLDRRRLIRRHVGGKRGHPLLVVLRRPRLVVQLGQRADLAAVGGARHRQRRPDEAPAPDAVPAAAHLHTARCGDREALHLEADAVGLGGQGRGGAARGLGAATQARRARLLAGAVVAVQRSALDGLVDRLDEHAVLGLGDIVGAVGNRPLQPAKVRLDRRRVAAVLEPLTLGTQDPLLLGVDVGHDERSRGQPRQRRVL